MIKIMRLLITLEELEKHLKTFETNCIFTSQQQLMKDLIEYITGEIKDELIN